MKTLFIPAKSKTKLDSIKLDSIKKNLPSPLAIAYSIQYLNLAKQIREILTSNIEITMFTQVLGCSKPKFPKTTKAILLVSNGKFHATALAYESKLPVYLYDSGKFTQIPQSDVEFFEKRRNIAYKKFLHADKVGIIVSTKPGQQKLKKAIELKKSLSNKKGYLFISNSVNMDEFENFQIDSWVNTACPRMDLVNPIVNIFDLKK